MEATLITIVLLALVTSLVMAGVAWRLMRDEQRRSDARVAALAADLDSSIPWPVATRAALADWTTTEPLSDAPDPLSAFPSQRAAPLGPDAAATSMFSTANVQTHDVKERLLPALVTGAVLMTACLAVVLLLSSIPTVSAPAAVARAVASAQSKPLELVGIEPTVTAGRIQLQGVVRNQVGATELPEVTAVASFFAADGAFLGSSSAPIAGPVRAGQEARFALVGDVMGNVARYRVSFRGAGDAPLSHVDRREGR